MSKTVVAASVEDAQAGEADKSRHARPAGAPAVQVGPGEKPAEVPGAGGGCGCGHQDSAGALPELDARAIPHALRHATIFGALDSVVSGSGMVLVAPHDPLPLLALVEQRSPGLFTVDYLERGPEAWRVRFIRA